MRFLASAIRPAVRALVVLAAPLSATAATADFGPLVTAGQIAAEPGTVILDIRGEAYAKGHIPGAVDAPYQLFRGPSDNPGRLVSEAHVESTLQNLGVEEDSPVVVVHQGSDQDDFGAAARVYWTLKSAGLKEIAILNGGMNAWAAEGRPTDTAPVTPDPTLIDITWTDRWRAGEAEVAQAASGDGPVQLLDARPAPFFEGQQVHVAAPIPGTVPGARNVPHTEWFASGTTAIAPAGAAAQVAGRLGITRDRPVVTFCNTGHWAATEWFALSELAGLPDVKLYPESVVGYAQSGRQLANTPGLVSNLLRQIRGL